MTYVETHDGDYTVVTFTNSDVYDLPDGVTEADILLVGGGSQGGTWCGGGGGGGGVLEQIAAAIAGRVPVFVGAGAPRATANGTGTNGNDSWLAGRVTPAMTSDTAPSGTSSCSSSYNSSYPAWKVFDQNAATDDCWCSQGGVQTGWLKYQLPMAVAVTKYEITSRNNTNNINPPKTWTLEGSNDGSDWDTLDTQTDVTDWASSSNVTKSFELSNTTPYVYYRLSIAAANGSGYVSVGELVLRVGTGYTAAGGGGGGAYPSETGAHGGSGGGGAHGNTAAAGTGTAGQGYDGGKGSANDSSGGGGGAGAVGSNAVTTVGGSGGDGVESSITGTATYYGGGGGGWGAGTSSAGVGLGGAGGGGKGGYNADSGTQHAEDAEANTGGGGGGGWYAPNNDYGGAGVSGIVVIRYLTPTAPAGTATLTITSRHKVGYLAAKTLTSRHKVRELLFVRKTVTSRHLVGYVYTPPPARLALRSRHIVNGVQGAARLALTSRHAVAELVRLTLTSRHLVRDVDPATLSLNSLHVVGFSARLALTSRHRVPRRTVILPGSDPPIEVVDDVTLYASFNGIDLNNGSTTHVLADGTDVGGNAPEYDTIRHYDGSLLIHDVRGAFSTITIPEIVTFSTAAGLSAWIAGLNAACRDGGSFTLQESDGATARTFLIAPGPEPSIPENNRFFIQHVAIFDLVLTRWPE